MVEAMRRHWGSAWSRARCPARRSAAADRSPSPCCRGWSSGAIVLLRVAGATLVLAALPCWRLRGRWRSSARRPARDPRLRRGGRRRLPGRLLLCRAAADVGVALLLEYLGVVLVVLWVWARTRRAPHRLTGLGVVLALARPGPGPRPLRPGPPDLVGVAVGPGRRRRAGRPLRPRRRGHRLPPVALAGLGMAVRRRRPRRCSAPSACSRWTSPPPTVVVAGAEHPGWVAIGELAARRRRRGIPPRGHRRPPARLDGRLLRRASPRCSSPCCSRGCCSASCPGLVQLVGGVLLVAGVVAVRLGELRRDRAARASRRGATRISTFPRTSPRLWGLPRRGTLHRRVRQPRAVTSVIRRGVSYPRPFARSPCCAPRRGPPHPRSPTPGVLRV